MPTIAQNPSFQQVEQVSMSCCCELVGCGSEARYSATARDTKESTITAVNTITKTGPRLVALAFEFRFGMG